MVGSKDSFLRTLLVKILEYKRFSYIQTFIKNRIFKIFNVSLTKEVTENRRSHPQQYQD